MQKTDRKELQNMENLHSTSFHQEKESLNRLLSTKATHRKILFVQRDSLIDPFPQQVFQSC